MVLNPRRTRAGARRSGVVGFAPGRRRSAASGRERRSRVWATSGLGAEPGEDGQDAAVVVGGGAEVQLGEDGVDMGFNGLAA